MILIKNIKLLDLSRFISLFSWDAPGLPDVEEETDIEVNTENDGSNEDDDTDDE